MKFSNLKTFIRHSFIRDDLSLLHKSMIELNDYHELQKVFGWKLDPVLLDDPALYTYRFVEDVNQRRLRDAESLSTVVRNACQSACLEIGTGKGFTTAMIAANAPQATIYTVNIPPEEFENGGTLTTMKLDRQEIGSYYRGMGLSNIKQIYANTANWEPDIEPVDIVFIDGSHDSKFVYNDTAMVMGSVKPGSFILWHDLNLSLIHNFHWIYSVCLGIERLFACGALQGRIYHVRDSWIGIYQVKN